MSFAVPFRLTSEDLPDLDAKTRAGLEPLLEALNATLGQLVAAQQASARPRLFSSTFTTENTGAAYVDVNPGSPAPQIVTINPLRRVDGVPMNAAYAASGGPISSGYRFLFVGLDPLTKYAFTVAFQ